MLSLGVIVSSADRKWREAVSQRLDGIQDKMEVKTLEPNRLLEAAGDSENGGPLGKAHVLVVDVRSGDDAERLAEVHRNLPGSTILAVVDEEEAGHVVAGLYKSGANVCLPRRETPTETAEIVRLGIGFFLDIARLPEASRMSRPGRG